MADQSDVEASLVTAIAAILYPQGADAPSLIGSRCRIFRGWPSTAALNADLAAEVINITIFPDGSGHHDTTRYSDEPRLVSRNVPTLIVDVAGTTVSFSGVVSAGQVAGILADNMAVVHRVQTGETLELVVATLGAYLRTRRMVSVVGASVTIPNARAVIGRVVADQTVQRETRRQRQGFRATMWCPSAALRDTVAGLIDRGLSGSNWLALPDRTSGFICGATTKVFDQSLNANLYRRDVVFDIEYPTTISEILPTMIFGNLNFTPADAGSVQTLLA